MPPFRSFILSFLVLLSFTSSRSFAINNAEDSSSYEEHLLTVQEYCQFLIAMASTEDVHGLYDSQTMGREIIRALSPEGQQAHFLYGIANGVAPQSPMLGLTQLDGMRFCNWMETSLFPINDRMIASTETGSYFLHQDGTFETNHKAQFSLILHDDGTFELISKFIKNSTSPLMFFFERNSRKSYEPPSTAQFPRFFSTADQNTENHRAHQRLNTDDCNHIIAASLSEIVHGNNDDHDDSLIGHTRDETQNGNYIAIQDINFYGFPLPGFLKACLMDKETRQKLEIAYEKIAIELQNAIKDSDAFKEKLQSGVMAYEIISGRTDWGKVTQTLDSFTSSLSAYNLTRARLKAFCTKHQITVPKPVLSSTTKACSNSRSGYGSFGSL